MTGERGAARSTIPATGSVDVQGLSYVAGVTRQAGAMAWRERDGEIEIAIVTSRRTGRWVFPKGGIDDGMTEAETATNELYEEAGIVGIADQTPIGTYRTAKIRPPLIWTIEITLYPVEITQVLEDWLEIKQRERRFVRIDEAAQFLAEPDMVALVRSFANARQKLVNG